MVFSLGEGTIARYKVEEVLANAGFKIATGETTDVAGSIAFDADGAVAADASRIAVQAATLQTDSGRRDRYVRNRTLETDTYPEVVFQPTLMEGLPPPDTVPTGPLEISITGDLTVKDQTREVTWDGTAEFAGDGTVSGVVAVEFTFDDFGMTKPSVAIVLSVEDTIRLELDFVGTITAK
jgi:polyisoprenoid-binding protein YceI